ncbi:hypothetical protein Tco_0514877 [Tanacetum coccineum]
MEHVVNYSKFISLTLEYKIQNLCSNYVSKIIDTPTFSSYNFTLKKDVPEGPSFTPHIMAICNAYGPQDEQAPTTTHQTRGLVFEGSSSRAKTNHMKRSKKSSQEKEKNPIQPSVSTLMVTEMHKEASQATIDQTSLGTNSKERANPQLISDVSELNTNPMDKHSLIVHSKSASRGDASASLTTRVDLEKNLIPRNHCLKNRSTVEELETFDNQNKDSLIPLDDEMLKFDDLIKLIELQVKPLQPEFDKHIKGQDFGAHLPAKLKALPERVELNQWFKVLDAIPDIMNKVVAGLDKIAIAFSLASIKTGSSGQLKDAARLNSQNLHYIKAETITEPIISTIPITEAPIIAPFTQPPKTAPIPYVPPSQTEGSHNVVKQCHQNKNKELKKKSIIRKLKTEEERIKGHAIETERNKGKQFLFKIFGWETIEEFYKMKVVYDRKNGTDEIINEFKVTDLHLTEWSEVLDRFELDHSTTLGEQDVSVKLIRLAKKKIRNFDATKDYFRSTKRYKECAQFDNHPIGTMLNELVLGMIYFNDLQRHEFISINDFKD